MDRDRIFQRDNITAARDLRQRMTPAERRAWALLRDSRLGGIKFRRQHPVGPYVLDFCCASQRLVIELDGGVHSFQLKEDEARQNVLESMGYRFLRFQNDTLFFNPEAFIESILNAAKPTASTEEGVE